MTDVVDKDFARRLPTYLWFYGAWLLIHFVLSRGFEDPSNWIWQWDRWDSSSYQKIWEEGYDPSDPRALVFPPGYSLISGVVATLTFSDFRFGAFLVNVISFFASVVLMTEFFGRRVGIKRELFFALALTSPPAYFVFPAYSDTLFALMLWSVVWLATMRPKSWVPMLAESLLLMAMPWVRITGYSLLSWVLLRRWSALMIVVSLVGWLVLNKLVAGSAMYFVEAQALYLMPSGHFLDGLFRAAKDFFPVPVIFWHDDWVHAWQTQVLPLVYLVTLCFTCAWLLYKKELLLALTIVSIVFISHNQGFWRSVVRYDLPLIPCIVAMLISLAQSQKNRHWRAFGYASMALLGLVQLALQLEFARLFLSGRWAF